MQLTNIIALALSLQWVSSFKTIFDGTSGDSSGRNQRTGTGYTIHRIFSENMYIRTSGAQAVVRTKCRIDYCAVSVGL